jgi:hypothetical protein
MWFVRAGFPPGTRAKKNALLAPNHAQRLGAFPFAFTTRAAAWAGVETASALAI